MFSQEIPIKYITWKDKVFQLNTHNQCIQQTRLQSKDNESREALMFTDMKASLDEETHQLLPEKRATP